MSIDCAIFKIRQREIVIRLLVHKTMQINPNILNNRLHNRKSINRFIFNSNYFQSNKIYPWLKIVYQK